jgi:hypothetical protein
MIVDIHIADAERNGQKKVVVSAGLACIFNQNITSKLAKVLSIHYSI